MQKSSKARSYPIREDALMSVIAGLRRKLAGTEIACEAIGLFLLIVDLAALLNSVQENALERHSGDMARRQDALEALQRAGLISIRLTSEISGVGLRSRWSTQGCCRSGGTMPPLFDNFALERIMRLSEALICLGQSAHRQQLGSFTAIVARIFLGAFPRLAKLYTYNIVLGGMTGMFLKGPGSRRRRQFGLLYAYNFSAGRQWFRRRTVKQNGCFEPALGRFHQLTLLT